ncbi:MAG: SDR family NAD(P)-dependent oxidoreductase [Bacteroidetes bacterium]|nr:SDR family NAD(P)-dependent oxidoreductase [Bacteroidota bacterium]
MKRKGTWTLQDIPNQSGRVAIVTGSTSGIGLITARELAGKGATVVLAVRNRMKAENAAERIRAVHPDAKLDIISLDLANLRAIEKFPEHFRASHGSLDILINNAGVMIPPYTLTADGFELQIGVNHLGHFALTGLLFDMLLRTPGSRVVTVSSGAHKMGKIDLDDLNWQRRRYRKWQAYGDSKIANLYFTLALQRRFAASDSDTIAVAAHPGVAMTELQRHSRFLEWSSKLIAHDVERAALPTLRAATDPGVKGGEYFGPGGFLELSGHPERVSPIRRAMDTRFADRLWSRSEELTGVRFDHAAARSAA